MCQFFPTAEIVLRKLEYATPWGRWENDFLQEH